jgi:hypothetical protein
LIVGTRTSKVGRISRTDRKANTKSMNVFDQMFIFLLDQQSSDDNGCSTILGKLKANTKSKSRKLSQVK